jgi:hypothetical protein
VVDWICCAHVYFQFREHPASRQKIGEFTRALFYTLGSHHTLSDRFAPADLGLPESLSWEDGPKEVFRAIVEQDSMIEATGNYQEFMGVFLYLLQVKENTQNARFFVTQDLRMGLALLNATTGDWIAMLASGNAPFVLRPVPEDYAGEEAYRIIGGCFVEGTVIEYEPFSNVC